MGGLVLRGSTHAGTKQRGWMRAALELDRRKAVLVWLAAWAEPRGLMHPISGNVNEYVYVLSYILYVN